MRQNERLLDVLLPDGALAWMDSYMGYVWLVIAIAFLFAELNTPGLFFFLSFAVGAVGAAILAFVGYSFFIQCVVGLIAAMVSFFIMRMFLKRKKMSEVEYSSAVTNIDALVGREGIVAEQIKPYSNGQVKIGGETWQARTEGEVVVGKGAIVVVLRVEGNTVVVQHKIVQKPK